MKNQIEYKGYLADLVVDTEDDCIYGEVVNAEKLHLVIEGATVADAKQAFETAIDDYLADCLSGGWDIEEPKVMATGISVE